MFCFFLCRLQIEDPRFTKLLSSQDKVSDGIGNGFIEDFLPPLRLWPTKKFTELMKLALEFNDYVLDRLQEHKISFDASKYFGWLDNISESIEIFLLMMT